jgi:hypothetical protein
MDSLTECVGILKSLLLDPDGNPSISGSEEDNKLIKRALDKLESVVISEYKDVWVAWTNTNLTDGYGRSVPLVICEMKPTAERLGKGKSVQGSDCRVEKVTAVRVDGQWMSCVDIKVPSKDDKTENDKGILMQKAEARAIELGLTPEEIMAIKG